MYALQIHICSWHTTCQKPTVWVFCYVSIQQKECALVSSRGFKKHVAKQNKQKRCPDAFKNSNIPLVTAQCAGVKTRCMSQDPVPHSTTVRESWVDLRWDRARRDSPTPHSVLSAAPADRTAVLEPLTPRLVSWS